MPEMQLFVSASTEMDATDIVLSRLRAAAIDGRMQNGRYRQKQLWLLHAALLSHREALQTAICETGNTMEEAEMEWCLTAACVKGEFEALDFEKELRDEYRVADGESFPERRVGLGIVAIHPTEHTLLYSAIAPLCAAVAAGNCVVLQVCVL